MALRSRILAAAVMAALSSHAHAQLVGGQWETLFRIDGQSAMDNFGASVSGAGDVDGDGIDDLIVGAWLANPGGLAQAGAAYVYSGTSGSLLRRLDGESPYDWFGSSVAGAGDVDGDGFDDLIVGASRANSGGGTAVGAAYVYSGATGHLLFRFDGAATGDGLGNSVSGAGDVDGDGFDDLIVGANFASPGGLLGAGSAFVYSGATGSVLFRFDGTTALDNLGCSVSGAGDVDGDNVPDLIIGSNGANPGGLQDAGSALVYSGATGVLRYRFDGESAADRLGTSVSRAGDVDGDGFIDLIVGAPDTDLGTLSRAGAARVYSGATGALLHQFDGASQNDRFGNCVARAGDVDGDGFGDLFIGANGADPGGLADAGSAYVYSGATWSLLGRFDGETAGDVFGLSVASVGDVDGDGIPELVVGAKQAESGGLPWSGSVYIQSLDPYLLLDNLQISYSSNQPVQFDLDFPASEAGAHYAILLSISGTGPSVLNGLDIPLTLGALSQAALSNPTMHGTLDANAKAQHSLRLHRKTPPGAIGKTIYLAAATFDAGTQAGRMSSIVRYVQIVP